MILLPLWKRFIMSHLISNTIILVHYFHFESALWMFCLISNKIISTLNLYGIISTLKVLKNYFNWQYIKHYFQLKCFVMNLFISNKVILIHSQMVLLPLWKCFIMTILIAKRKISPTVYTELFPVLKMLYNILFDCKQNYFTSQPIWDYSIFESEL